MKKAIKIRMHYLLLTLGMLLVFAMGTANAQNNRQNVQCQRFTQVDVNADGFIGIKEMEKDQLALFDKDGDGLLNRNEFRAMNRKQNAAGNNPQGVRRRLNKKQDSGNGQCQGIRNQQKNKNGKGNCCRNNAQRNGRQGQGK